MCISEFDYHWVRYWLISRSVPNCKTMADCRGDHLEQTFVIIKIQICWVFLQETAFENVVCKLVTILFWLQWINTLRLRENCHDFADDIFKRTFVEKKTNIFIFWLSQKFVPNIPLDNQPLFCSLALNGKSTNTWPSDNQIHWCTYLYVVFHCLNSD